MFKRRLAALSTLALTLISCTAATRTFAPSIVLDDKVFSYSGPWVHVSGKTDGRFGGTSTRSERRGAIARIRFNGSALALYAVRGPAGGYGTIFLDGHRVGRADFFAWHITPRYPIYRTPLLARAPHELDVVVDGGRTKASFGTFVNIDAAVIGDPVAVAAARPRFTAHPLVDAGSVEPSPFSGLYAFIAAIVAVVAIALVALTLRRRRERLAVRTPPAYGVPVHAPPPQPPAPQAPAPLRETNGTTIDWPRRLFPDAALDDAGRRSILTLLAANGRTVDPAILAAAFEQERTPQMRAAVIATIRDGAYRDALPTVRAAYREGDDALRTVAVGALARVGDYATIEEALEDPSAIVATVAAYELVGAYGNERASSAIAQRITDPVRRREITGTLGLFS